MVIRSMFVQGRGASAQRSAHAGTANSARVSNKVSCTIFLFMLFNFNLSENGHSFHVCAGPWRHRPAICTRPNRRFGKRLLPS